LRDPLIELMCQNQPHSNEGHTFSDLAGYMFNDQIPGALEERQLLDLRNKSQKFLISVNSVLTVYLSQDFALMLILLKILYINYYFFALLRHL
jgi:hypothetical protein